MTTASSSFVAPDVSVRPRAAGTPSVSKRSGVTWAPTTRSGSSPSVRFAAMSVYAEISENVRVARRYSISSRALSQVTSDSSPRRQIITSRSGLA